MASLSVASHVLGAYKTIGSALKAAKPGDIIAIAPGEYREKLHITIPRLTLSGAGLGLTRIVWNDSAQKLLPNGEAMGTFNSYTVYVGARGVCLSNLTIDNDAGPGCLAGQAIALYADSDMCRFESCRIRSYQDSLCTGPLPKNPIPKGINLIIPVAGLGDDKPLLPFRQLYRDCELEGDVDFIFGSAAAVFDRCLVRTLLRPGKESYIAAPSTYPGENAGFLFYRCALVSSPTPKDALALYNESRGSKNNTIRGNYLGRPWRTSGRCVYIDCEIGAHIDPEGWHDWNKPEARYAGFFGEYGNTGVGAALAARPNWVHRLGAAEAAKLVEDALTAPF